MTVSISGTNGVTFPDGSLQAAAASPYVNKNRIINGDMRIDQRNAGASVNPTDGQYTVDRWFASRSQASKLTVQQNAGSVTPPVGFVNYLGVTSSSAYSITSSDYFIINQAIEGLNISDLGWGTANAKTITISFWVRSSLTGTFGGVIQNNAGDRAYPFTYTISSANTWEQKSITITGDTSGTWLTTNGIGLTLRFGLGVGSTYSATANAWTAGYYLGSTGAQSVVGTNGATFYITGVQLEIGTSATPFERRLYGQELAACQRYYWRNTTSSGNYNQFGLTTSRGTSNSEMYVQYPVPMRASPSSVDYSALLLATYAGGSTSSVSSISISSTNAGYMSCALNLTAAGSIGTGGQALQVIANNNSAAYLGLSAEL